jgi:hypothetical protein
MESHAGKKTSTLWRICVNQNACQPFFEGREPLVSETSSFSPFDRRIALFPTGWRVWQT